MRPTPEVWTVFKSQTESLRRWVGGNGSTQLQPRLDREHPPQPPNPRSYFFRFEAKHSLIFKNAMTAGSAQKKYLPRLDQIPALSAQVAGGAPKRQASRAQPGQHYKHKRET